MWKNSGNPTAYHWMIFDGFLKLIPTFKEISLTINTDVIGDHHPMWNRNRTSLRPSASSAVCEIMKVLAKIEADTNIQM